MKILFYNPTCGFGIEQIGYVYTLMLKRLGHDVELWNTQGRDIRKEKIKPRIATGGFDAIILNSARKKEVLEMITEPTKNVYAITHTSEPLPDFVFRLSLNYLSQYRILSKNNRASKMMPITYPYSFRDIEFNKRRENDFVFIGRWNKYKFHPKVKDFMIEKEIKIKKAYLSEIEEGYKFNNLIEKYKTNKSITEVYKLLKKSKFLLLPSTTESISLVAGEALVNGCIPIVYEDERKIHEQFINCISASSANNFNKKISELKNKGVSNQLRKRVFNFSNKNWSLSKSLSELELIFGKEKEGNINLAFEEYSDKKRDSYKDCLPYDNATKITKTSL